MRSNKIYVILKTRNFLRTLHACVLPFHTQYERKHTWPKMQGCKANKTIVTNKAQEVAGEGMIRGRAAYRKPFSALVADCAFLKYPDFFQKFMRNISRVSGVLTESTCGASIRRKKNTYGM